MSDFHSLHCLCDESLTKSEQCKKQLRDGAGGARSSRVSTRSYTVLTSTALSKPKELHDQSPPRLAIMTPDTFS